MTRRISGHSFILCSVLLLLFCLSCGSGQDPYEREHAVWFLQLSDPHLFHDTSKDLDPVKKGIDSTSKATREKQEALDQTAVSDFWKEVPSLAADKPISFLLVTGDLGVEPCSISDDPPPAEEKDRLSAKDCIDKINKDQDKKNKRDNQVEVVAKLFGDSPVRDVYVVAGNNDIASEVAADNALDYFNQFIDDVQRKIDEASKGVQLHNLTRCYGSGGTSSSCFADIAESPYRLIGFPSYSFKNCEPGFDTNTAAQEKQFDTFRVVLDQARQAGKKVLVLSHIPLIDDPHTLAQLRYTAKTPNDPLDPNTKATRSPASTWNVSKKLSDEWEDAIASDAVAGVFAGHLHDSHKEIYRPPYAWSNVNDHKSGFAKLYMAPPLSVKNQDTSPIQARGFSLVRLEPDSIEYSIYWYDAEHNDFAPDRPDEHARRKRLHSLSTWEVIKNSLTRIVCCVWQHLCPTSIEQAAILLIALLAAFLTIVQVWRIPPLDNPLQAAVPPPVSTTPTSQAGATPPAGAPPAAITAFDPSPFASNFGKTVLTGLGGLLAETVLKSFEGDTATAGDKQFYIVWFILLFFALLILGALLRALVEAVRARIAIIYFPLARPTRPDRMERNPVERCWDWLAYWFLRCVHWIFSLRTPLLTFFDTFTNLIQGKNETITRVFADTIIDQQRNVVRVAHAIRRQVHDVILQTLQRAHDQSTPAPPDDSSAQLTASLPEPPRSPAALQAPAQVPPAMVVTPQAPATLLAKPQDKLSAVPQDVRVSISVLSADQTKVFYIARSPGSSLQAFPKRSVAWISVFTGSIRWYKNTYRDKTSQIVLFDNTRSVIPDMEQKIYLKSNYQSRDDDYEAFVIFPVPWPQRGFGTQYVKGAIHISFRKLEHFEKVWAIKDDVSITSPAAAGTNQPGPDLEYRLDQKMIDESCTDGQLRATLSESIAVLGELLRGFNENIYLSSPGTDYSE